MTIRRFQLERYLAGEVEGDERAELERLLEGDPQVAAALDALKREQARFEERVPYASFRIEHERRKARVRARRPWRWIAALTSSLAVAAAAVALLMVEPSVDGPGPSAGTRLKGDAVALSLYVVQPNGEATAGLPGQRLSAGAVVQLTYEAKGQRYGALLGLDGNGLVTQFWPSEGSAMARLDADEGSFPFALELDATPGRERFYAVFAEEPRQLDALRAALEAAGDGEPSWPSEVAVATTWIEKPEPETND